MRNKIVNIIASILTVGILAGGVCAAGYASRDKDTGKWFKNKDITSWSWTEKNKTSDKDNHMHTYDLSTWVQGEEGHWHASTCEHTLGIDYENHTFKDSVCTVCGYKYGSKGADMIVSTDSENGIAVKSRIIAPLNYANYGISPQAETAYILTAEVKDETGTSNGVPQAVNAVGVWENAESLWANGKNVNDYIKIQRSADNEFVVSCLQAFGEPVLINVSSVASDVTAVKRCNYVSRVQSVYLDIGYNCGYSFDFCSMPNLYDERVNYGTGTVRGEITRDYFYFQLSDYFTNFILNSSYYEYFVQQCERAGYVSDWSNEVSLGFTEVADGDNIYLSWWRLFNMPSDEFASFREATNECEYFKYAILDAINHNPAPFDAVCRIRYSYSYDGIIYNSSDLESVCNVSIKELGFGSLPEITDVIFADGDGDFVF